MISRDRLARLATAVLACAVALDAFSGAHLGLAVLGSSATVTGNTLATAASFDITAPTISASVISKTTLYIPGYIRPSSAFYVYANVADTGAGASGVATVTADVSSIKAGSTAVALVAGTYSVGGVSYGYRSAAFTADAKPAGTYAYSIRAVDNAGNVATNSSFTVVVDTTAPSAADVQTTNTGTSGRPTTGDTIVFTYSEPIDPQPILAGWTGISTSVTVRLTNAGMFGAADTFAIWNGAGSAQLPLGSVATNGDYVTMNSVFSATMVRSGSTIIVTLGALTSGTVTTNTTARTMSWTPSATATDAAGNACSTTTRNETGTIDIDF